MPYKSVSELPGTVQALPEHGKSIFLSSFNSAAKEYEDETRAFAVAWAAVKNSYEKDASGKWVAKKKENASERMGFEEFRAIELNKPSIILPLGKFYRSNRELDITEQRLREMEQNFRQGLPRYGVMINVEHGNDDSQPGKIGKVSDVRYVPGVGLQVTATELTDAGKKLVEEDRYAGPSPEIVWSLNEGAMYQDPDTGKWVDNVLVGLALTNSAFFGNHVSIFSAKPQAKEKFIDQALTNYSDDEDGDDDSPAGRAATLAYTICCLDDMIQDCASLPDLVKPLQTSKDAAKKALKVLVDLFSETDHEEFETKSLKMSFDAPDAGDVHIEGGSKMKIAHADFPKHHGEDDAPDMSKIKAHADKLKDNKDPSDAETQYLAHLKGHLADAPKEDPKEEEASEQTLKELFAEERLDSFRVRAEKAEGKLSQLAEQFAYERNLRRASEFEAEAENFNSLPATSTELGKHLMWLNDADSSTEKEHFAYFKKLLEVTNSAMGQSQLFQQFSSAQSTVNSNLAGGQHPFLQAVEKIRKESFAAKPYSEGFTEAWKLAETNEATLAQEYAMDRRRSNV